MHKVFKFLYGGWSPYTYNSGSSIMFSQPTSSMPNYKAAAQEKNNSFMTSTLLSRMIMTPSKNPTLTYSFNRMPSLTTPDMSGTLASLFKLQMTTPYSEQLTKQGTDLLNKDLSKETEGAGLKRPDFNKIGNIMGTVSDVASNIFKTKPQSTLTLGLDTGYDATADTVMMFNPIVGGFLKAGGLATDIVRSLGVGTDQVTTEDQILDSKFLALTPMGLANSLGAKKGQTLNKDMDYMRVRADMGAGYGGALSSLDAAEKYSGKKMGNLLGLRDRANKKVYQGNYDLARMLKIWNQGYINNAIQGTLSDMAFNKENLRMKGGWLDGAISFGRRGMIIEPSRLRMIRRIAQSYKPLVETELSEEEIIQFKNGGSFNVIPEGSLHARLHHMEDADGLTKKGIPVVVESDGGELELQAEIELNEIIFRLEVTNEIEKLMKDGSDNAAIECGKMLVKEIFENTDDRTGLIESLEEPKENLEDVVKEHRIFQEGGTIPPELNQKQTGEEPVGYTEDGIPLYIKGDGSIGPLTEVGTDNLFDLIKNSNANWAKRLQDPKRKFIPLKEGGWGNFKLSWSEDETGIMVYPEILEINGKLIDLSEDRDKAWESAVKNKDYIYFPSREAAEWFTKNYKKYYKGFNKKEKQ